MTEQSVSNSADPVSAWADATLATILFAIDPAGTGGIAVHAHAGPVRDRWLSLSRSLLPPSAPFMRVPIHATDDRLLGGLDLGATLSAGSVVAMRGLLAEADGGVIVLTMAERLSSSTAARIAAAIDRGDVALERDGLARVTPTRFGVIALDEGVTEDEKPSTVLLDRLAFRLDLTGLRMADATEINFAAATVDKARQCLSAVTVGDDMIEALCAAALALGVGSLRGTLFAVQVARCHAALDGRATVVDVDAAAAARLVLGPRATQLSAVEPSPPSDEHSSDQADVPPPESDDPETQEQPTEPDPSKTDDQDQNVNEQRDQALDDLVLAAAIAAVPAGLLAALRLGRNQRGASRTSGKAGAARASKQRGRPIGAIRGEPRSGSRLSLIETLRAAAPWQPLRARERRGWEGPRIDVRREDFRITRFKHRTETTTIFVVDASGSSALNRLAEAKGAVELLLADCYVRRDNVALIAFRGTAAELLLPPTRSLVRAKRCLAGLPGGGGTPLATAIDAAYLLAQTINRRRETPIVVFLTDGRANISRDGVGGRPKAEADALAAARQFRAADMAALLVDISPQAQPVGQRLAAEMGAQYLALPYADARLLSKAIKLSVQAGA